MPTISQKDAHLILRQSAKFPQKGDQCNASCAFYFCCQNSKDFEQCKGFLMLNGESEKLLRRGLTKHDLEYIENAHTFIQRSIDKGRFGDAEVIIRDMSQLREKATSQPTERPSGLGHMLDCALGVPNTSNSENIEPESPPSSEFRAMLSASAKGNVEERSFAINILAPADFGIKFPQNCSEDCPFKRHCGSFPANQGNLCIHESEQYKNDKFISK